MRYRLQRSQDVPAELEEVFRFFCDAENLQRLTPGNLDFHILTPRPIELAEGTVINYRLRLLGVRFRWQSRIDWFERNAGFRDVQVRGPYRVWEHTHRFVRIPGGTRLTDEVDYELPYGPVGRAAHALFVRRALRQIFDYRREQITALFGSRV